MREKIRWTFLLSPPDSCSMMGSGVIYAIPLPTSHPKHWRPVMGRFSVGYISQTFKVHSVHSKQTFRV